MKVTYINGIAGMSKMFDLEPRSFGYHRRSCMKKHVTFSWGFARYNPDLYRWPGYRYPGRIKSICFKTIRETEDQRFDYGFMCFCFRVCRSCSRTDPLT